MTEDLTIQCENCGTIYPATDEVCPYCGQPQPLPEPPYAEDLLPDQEFADQFYPGQGDEPDQAYFPPVTGMPVTDEDTDEYPAPYPFDEPLAEDDIFAVAGEEAWPDEYDEYGEEFYDEDDEELDDLEAGPRRRTWPRIFLGCVGIVACIIVFYGGIGLLAIRQGLQERTVVVQTEAEEHYQRGQEHLANQVIELAIAEFELALSLNPNLHIAREALHEAQRISQNLPTPTSEARLAAATALLNEAEALIIQEKWFEAVEKLSQVRDLDPDHQVERVSELLYQANYQLGLQLISPDRIDEALLSFERALVERPDDQAANQQMAKATLYRDGQTYAAQGNLEKAVDAFRRLYLQDGNYLDVKQRLLKLHVQWGDELAAQEEWCLAEAQYIEAVLLQPNDALKARSDQIHGRCQDTSAARSAGASPAVKATSPATDSAATPGADTTSAATTPAITATTSATPVVSSGQGQILFSVFNPNETRWEILSTPVNGGAPKTLVVNGTMPALSPNGKLLVYHSKLIEAEGFHVYDLTSGEDRRITLYKQHVLPRWGGDNNQFLFAAQEPATQRWLIHLGFADGKSAPLILGDGRTPDWSPDNRLIAYQGADPDGNNPGLYVVPANGGEPTRVTNHESDRAPDFSPDGAQLAYMSTKDGNWNIYTVSPAGSAPRQITMSPGNNGLPAWSPDGTQIAYVSDAAGSWGIYVVNAAGGAPVKVADWDGNRPDWLMAQLDWAR
ncbi:MAG: PD40 domain-containing protein [Anaerolineae bacterium]|nr:PD40 domain-containing protein [Anaerolineae bacterium]